MIFLPLIPDISRKPKKKKKIKIMLQIFMLHVRVLQLNAYETKVQWMFVIVFCTDQLFLTSS